MERNRNLLAVALIFRQFIQLGIILSFMNSSYKIGRRAGGVTCLHAFFSGSPWSSPHSSFMPVLHLCLSHFSSFSASSSYRLDWCCLHAKPSDQHLSQPSMTRSASLTAPNNHIDIPPGLQWPDWWKQIQKQHIIFIIFLAPTSLLTTDWPSAVSVRFKGRAQTSWSGYDQLCTRFLRELQKISAWCL